jgi:hypothetical protein
LKKEKQDYLSLKKEVKRTQSSLAENLANIKKQINIENLDFQGDKIAYSTQRIILEALLDTIPIAIENFKNNPKQSTANAISGLITKTSDLFGEIRASQNLSGQVDFILSEIIDPLLKSILNDSYSNLYTLKKEIKLKIIETEFTKIEPLLNDFFKNAAEQMKKNSDTAEEKLKQYLLEV